jgi:hypothetical protein
MVWALYANQLYLLFYAAAIMSSVYVYVYWRKPTNYLRPEEVYTLEYYCYYGEQPSLAILKSSQGSTVVAKAVRFANEPTVGQKFKAQLDKGSIILWAINELT